MSRTYPGKITFMMETPPSQPPAISTPTYRIFRDKHGIPQFEPKRGTQALKDALIYSFPTLETELQLMQAALRKFFDSEKGSSFVFELPERDLQTSLVKKQDSLSTTVLQSSKASLKSWKVSRASRTPSRPSSRASSRAPSRASSRCETPTGEGIIGGTMTTWMLSNGQELDKRKRQPYDPVKRRKVAENRGNACEKHRAAKTACDPEECPQNKLYGRSPNRPRRESEVSAYDTPLPATPVTEQHQFTPIIAPTTNHHELDIFFEAMDMDALLPKIAQATFDVPSNLDDSWQGIPPLHHASWPSVQGRIPLLDQVNMQPLLTVAPGTASIATSASQPSFAIPELHVVPEEPHHHDEHMVNAPQAIPNESTSPADPFMGWASKRASNLADEYGWVLSHVEAL